MSKQGMISAGEKKILVGVDGSRNALDAVRYVAKICSPEDLRVKLFYVMNPAPYMFSDLEWDARFRKKMKEKHDKWMRGAKEMAEKYLVDAGEILMEAGFDPGRLELTFKERKVGIARDILLESREGYDAVVVGRRGLSKLEEIYFGSVSHKIIEGARDVAAWVVDGDIHAKKMLLAVDGSENSRKAVEYVGSLAKHTDAELTLYHVMRKVGLGFVDDIIPRDEELERYMEEEREKNIRRMFDEYTGILKDAGVPRERVSREYRSQSASRAGDIVKEAKKGGYGTIVMGRRGLSKVKEFLMGRVTRKVLQNSQGLAVWIVN